MAMMNFLARHSCYVMYCSVVGKLMALPRSDMNTIRILMDWTRQIRDTVIRQQCDDVNVYGVPWPK